MVSCTERETVRLRSGMDGSELACSMLYASVSLGSVRDNIGRTGTTPPSGIKRTFSRDDKGAQGKHGTVMNWSGIVVVGRMLRPVLRNVKRKRRETAQAEEI